MAIKSEHSASLGGIAPFGYRWRNGSLAIDEAEAPIRKLIYELFLKHKRKKTVAKILNDLGYKTRNQAAFSDTTIDRLLRDTTAKGIRLIGGEEAEVEPIVEIDLWERANAILNSNSNTKMTKQPVQLFAGMIFCFCGGKMVVPSNLAKYVCINCRHKIGTEDLEEIFISKLHDMDLVLGDETNSNNPFTYWPDFTAQEKRIIVEQIINKIIVGRDAIDIELSVAPGSFKTAAFEQQSETVNKALDNKQSRENLQPTSQISPPKVILNEPLLNEKEAAKFLGMSRMTLWRRRNAGDIKFFRDGIRPKYSKEKHLIPYLESREQK